MREIIEYRVVFGDGRQDLVDIVNSLIKEGWQPFSGLILRAYPSSHPDFYQSMVKYKPDKTNSI